MEEWIICIITLIFGMLMFHILKGVCSCKVIEGKECYYRPGEEKTGFCSGEIHTYYEKERIAGHTNIRRPDVSDLYPSQQCVVAHTGCDPEYLGRGPGCKPPNHECISFDRHLDIIDGGIDNHGLSQSNAVLHAHYLSPHPHTCEDNPGLCKCADIRFHLLPDETYPYEVCIKSSTDYIAGDRGKVTNYACGHGQGPIMAAALNMYEYCN